MSGQGDDLDQDVVKEILARTGWVDGPGPVLDDDEEQVLPAPVIEEEPPADPDVIEEPPEEFIPPGGADPGGGGEPRGKADPSGKPKPWEAAGKRRDMEMPPGVVAPGAAPGAGLIPPVWEEVKGPELVADPGRVAVVPGSAYPKVMPDGEVSQRALTLQVQARLGFLAGVIAPRQAIQEHGQAILNGLSGKEQIKSVPKGSAKHTPPTATRDRLPAIDNLQPTIVEKGPALVVTGLDVDRMLGGAVAVPVGGGGLPAPLPSTGSWLDEVTVARPAPRGRGVAMDPPEQEEVAEPRGRGLSQEQAEDSGLPVAEGVDPEQVMEPGLPHHRFESGSVPSRRPKPKVPTGDSKPSEPAPSLAGGPVKPGPFEGVKAAEKGDGGGLGLLRDFVVAGVACLVGGGLVMGWGRISAAREHDGAVTLVVERREMVVAYLDSEVAALEREVGDDDRKLAEATKAMGPEPSADELRRIEVMAREKAQVELLLEVMRARKRGFVEGVHNGGQ